MTWSVQGRLAVVTGASSGVGEQIATGLAANAATVILVARDATRLEAAKRRIARVAPGSDLILEPVDLSDLDQVRTLATRLTEQNPSIVVSNAAVIAPLDDRTSAGLHRSLATNHLAPYLLLRTLAEQPAEQPRRFVVVGGHPGGLRRVPVDLDDLNADTGRGLGWPPSIRPFAAYGRTKNMNAMFVYGLAQRLRGTSTTVNGAHPGIVRGTRLNRHDRGALRIFGSAINRLSGTDDGAHTPLWLVTSPDVEGVTGQFYVDRKPVQTAPHTTDPERVERLWRKSARLVGLPDSASI
ncbi:SDR family NAD(P)-dependent oxidoreductase [Phytoactinopolyspora halotolerans]|uniref:SDR family NAD(P)-dependent oxidoreductase n=1 Tax=Phytoactinopolyspora halotolerans TaxID=1981512 RepID=A0A6L9SGF3_9ACTN|nr:SDR family NAD(P)-dependent oxidoreductase [Phytoactinopolyspora halotolerans]NEE04209.1 SDR family NAD(P)-dependent oxidoreductase [Phytoactinopolyspora halotolerans]